MGRKAYPPLTPREVIKILTTRGFHFVSSQSSHHNYGCTRGGKFFKVTVDIKYETFGIDLIKSMIRQSGLAKEQFYCSTKSTAKKLGKRKVKKTELEKWLAAIE